jgi:CBS domain-containing protein/anti-sigma regulatory factor (Ser/Thr protein kinase)
MNRLRQIHKVQELVYELKIRDASVKDMPTISSDAMMSQVRPILRSKKTTAAPVVRGKKLLGIVSVEDYINWLMAGEEDIPVSERMSKNLITLFEDEPLVDAIKNFELYRYYEFPVLERETGNLVGIVTKFDVIVCLLKALDIDYYTKEIMEYSGIHFFNEVLADDTRLSFLYYAQGEKIELGGEIASKLKKNLQYLGIHPDIIRRVSIVTYEAEMNLIIYGGGGTIQVIMDKHKISIEVSDHGPGIADIEKVLLPGFSTAPDWIRELGFGAGMGLPNIKNNSDFFELNSTVGEGTVLRSSIPLEVI